jgi:dTDP-4-dehydrorhamnose 3,5-epimerase-like enzyme
MVVVVKIRETAIPGFIVVEDIDAFTDDRGSFRMWWRSDWNEQVGDICVQQLNVAHSKEVGTTRGSHVAPWNKYIHVIQGRALAVVVDARRESEKFGVVEVVLLDQTTALYVPAGCGNAYQTIDADVLYSYAVDQLWDSSKLERTISLTDEPFLGVQWPVRDTADWIMSTKDQRALSLSEVIL